MKEVFVILAFHAHEPLWELPQMLLENVEDLDLRQTLGNENWIVRRSAEGRDIYLALVNFARSMGITVTLEATNELLVQIASSHARNLCRTEESLSRRNNLSPLWPCPPYPYLPAD